ncbi:hypothetical protein TNCV_1871511 [Trichonephila clavipes]|nr:hypothetical protein TNCV_1871511 [Trichonephila clavipes]
MPTEQEAKPAVTPSSNGGAQVALSNFKEYDQCINPHDLANVYFFLDGTARQWYVNNEDALFLGSVY